MKIYLKGNGSNIPDFGWVDASLMSDLGDAEIVLRRNDSDGMASSFSKDIRFYGKAYEYIYKYLITDQNSRQNHILIEVWQDCCNPIRLVYTGRITVNTVDYCVREDFTDTNCSINTSSEELDYVSLVRKSLISRNNRWRDGKLFWDRVHQQIPYCEDIRPKSMHYFRFFIALFVTQTFFVLFPLLFVTAIIVGIINAASLILGSDEVEWTDLTGPFNSMREFIFESLPRWGIGCGYNHYAVKVVDYIQNAIEGYDNSIVFSSSIFSSGSAYEHTLMLISPTHEGEYTYFTNANTIDNNLVSKFATQDSPNWTLGELLDKLADVFNAEWWLDGKVLHFETKDLATTKEIWVDITRLPKDDIKSLCIKWTDAPNYMGARFQYTNDGFDACSDEAAYLYNDTVQFNPLTPSQDRLKDIRFQFAPARFRGDGLSSDAVDIFSSIMFIYNQIGFSSMPSNFDKNLLLSSARVSTPKLLIPEHNYAKDHTIIVNKNGTEGLNFNYPYWIDATYSEYNPNGYYDNPPNSTKRREGENLFQFFLSLDVHNAPDTLTVGRVFNIEIKSNCIHWNEMFDQGGKLQKNLYVKFLEAGLERIGTVDEVNITEEFIKITGKF